MNVLCCSWIGTSRVNLTGSPMLKMLWARQEIHQDKILTSPWIIAGRIIPPVPQKIINSKIIQRFSQDLKDKISQTLKMSRWVVTLARDLYNFSIRFFPFWFWGWDLHWFLTWLSVHLLPIFCNSEQTQVNINYCIYYWQEKLRFMKINSHLFNQKLKIWDPKKLVVMRCHISHMLLEWPQIIMHDNLQSSIRRQYLNTHVNIQCTYWMWICSERTSAPFKG